LKTVWKGNSRQFDKEIFDSLKKENFESLKRKILTVYNGKFNGLKGKLESLITAVD
jgi:aromatic ring-opening dioxygenase LigB subunit